MTRWNEETEAEFRADWAAGLTLVELAAKWGVSASTISTYSARFDCAPRRTDYQHDGSPLALKDGEWVPDASGVMRWVASA
jgi:transposase